MKEFEKIFKALANKRRLMIINVLKKAKEMPVSEIAEQIKLSFKATSKHLNILCSAGFIDKEKRSLQVYYFMDPTANQTIKSLLKII